MKKRTTTRPDLSEKMKKRAALLKKSFKGDSSFGVGDALRVLGGSRPTIAWTLWRLTDLGILKSTGKGRYSFGQGGGALAPALSDEGRRVRDLLQETGFEFLVTGLDILAPYMLHIPEQFPVMVYAEETSLEEVAEALTRQKLTVLRMPGAKKGRDAVRLPSQTAGTVWLYGAAGLLYGHGGLADPERAFVDLYMAVTRHGYPLALQELARIYKAMRDRAAINPTRLTKVASRRNIAEDIRFLRDHPRISKHARKLVEYL